MSKPSPKKSDDDLQDKMKKENQRLGELLEKSGARVHLERVLFGWSSFPKSSLRKVSFGKSSLGMSAVGKSSVGKNSLETALRAVLRASPLARNILV